MTDEKGAFYALAGLYRQPGAAKVIEGTVAQKVGGGTRDDKHKLKWVKDYAVAESDLYCSASDNSEFPDRQSW
ncbi:MAG: hypothetical protein QGH15_02220 [Kiritimatiellia bacterium]|nr:hypothetical protein [Kiritimatiellia bacterium]